MRCRMVSRGGLEVVGAFVVVVAVEVDEGSCFEIVEAGTADHVTEGGLAVLDEMCYCIAGWELGCTEVTLVDLAAFGTAEMA